MTQASLELGGPPPAKQHLSQHFTDPRLAEGIVRWGLSKGQARRRKPVEKWKCLEPSAGSGAFVGPLVSTGGEVDVVEIDPDWCQYLGDQYAPLLRVTCADYLEVPWPDPDEFYDLAVLNPPYEDGQDTKHVAKAMDESIRVLALVRLNFLSGSDRYHQIWSRLGTPAEPGEWSFDGLLFFRGRPRFSDAKGSPRHDFCAVYLSRDPDERWGACCPDWWQP